MIKPWRAAARSWFALVGVCLCVGAVVAAVVMADGRSGTEAAINDGGAWLLNRDAGAVGHLNREVLEVTAALRITASGSDFDVDQGTGIVLVHDRSDNRVLLLDERTYATRVQFVVSTGTKVEAVDGGAVLYTTEPLRVWVLSVEQLLEVTDFHALPPLFEAATSGSVGVGKDGSVVVAQLPAAGESGALLTQISNDPLPSIGQAQAVDIDSVDQLTPHGADAIVLSDGTAHRVSASGQQVLLEKVAVVQQAARTPSNELAWISESGDVVLSQLSSGDATLQGSVTGTAHLEPIFHNGCVFTVALQPKEFAKFCEGQLRERVSLTGSGGELRLRLVNGWVWINDLQTGGAWVASADTELSRLDDWGSALADEEVDDANATVENPGSNPEQKENPDADDAEFVLADELDEDGENEPPVAIDDTAATRSERPILIRVLDNDTDTDGDVLFISAVDLANTQHAIVTSPPGSDQVQVTPDAGFVGAVQFGYSVSDGRGGLSNALVSVDVLPLSPTGNKAPETKTDVATARAGTPVSLNVLDNDADPEGDTLVLTSIDAPSGVVTSDPNGQVTFTPETTGADGIIELTYVATDDYGATAEGLVKVRVRIAESNTLPDARNDLIVTNVGASARTNVLDNDRDPDNDAMYVAKQADVKAVPTGVTADELTDLRLTPDGNFYFAPPVPGTYIFEYLISDGQNNDRAQIRVEAQQPDTDQPPVAVRDDVTIPLGATRMVYVLDNDRDPNGDVVGIVEWDEAEGLEIRAVPGVGFEVTASVGAPTRTGFRYAISDGKNAPVSTKVVVAVPDIPAFNQPPMLSSDAFEVRAGRTSRLPVLLNDRDPEGGALQVTRIPELANEGTEFAVGAFGQTVEVAVPPEQTTGFTFGYDVADLDGAMAAATVDVRIIGSSEPNRLPVARIDTGRTVQDLAVSVDVLRNDSDPDSDFLTVESIAQQPTSGSVVLDATGLAVYTPVARFTGTDRFSYVVIDTEGGRSIGEVEVGVMPRPITNRPPEANPDRFTVLAGGASVELDVLSNDRDPDGDTLTVIDVGDAAVGLVRTDGSTVTYVPPPSSAIATEVSISYEISDGAGHTDNAVLTMLIEANAAILPPVAEDDKAGPVRAGARVSIPVLLNDSDPDGAGRPLRLSSIDPRVIVVGDHVEIVAGTSSEQFRYTITDAHGLSDSAVVTLFVVANEAPQIAALATETEADTPLLIDLSGRASDADRDPLFFVCCDAAQGGSVVIESSREDTLVVTFTPNDGFEGEASFSYSVDDLQGHLVSGSVSIMVLPPENRAPEILEVGRIDIEAGTTVPFDLTSLVADPDVGDRLTFEVLEIDDTAAVSLIGAVVTIAAPADSADDEIRIDFSATDSAGAKATGSIIASFTPTTIPAPTASADSAQTSQGLAVDINVLANDLDPLGSGLEITQLGASAAGVNVETAPGVVSFAPHPDFFGTATFTYTIADATKDVSRHSVAQVSVAVIGRPDAPTAPVATADNGVAIVVWTTPLANGAPIDSYRLAVSDLTAGGPTVVVDLGVQNSYTASGLVNGHEYSFQLQGHNVAGWGEYGLWSAPVRPDAIPAKPAAPQLTFDDGQLHVVWSQPTNEGSPLTEYKLEIGGGDSSIVSLPSSSTSYTWVGLSNGVEYQFRVVATNAAGDSDASGWSTPEHPLGAPLQPELPTAQRGNQFLDLNWTPPDNNGDQISSYEIELEATGQIVQVAGGGTTNYRWAQLENGVEYRFRVRASNRAPALGELSAWSLPVKPCSVPDAASAPTVVRGDKEVAVSWDEPSDQGCTISGYNVRANGSAIQTAGGGTISHSFTGLTNGTSYSFQVQAVNEEGPGAWSPVSVAVIPAGPPTAPTLASVAATAVGQLTASWGGATGNGTPITSYGYRINGGSATAVSGTSVVRNGLNNSTSYAIEVRSCNAVGCSAWSGSLSATTWGPPSAPASVSASAGNATASLQWAAPGSTGGQPVSSWEVTVAPGGVSPSSSLSFRQTYSGLTNGTTYSFSVRACNVVGCGPYGTAAATPTAPPPYVNVSVGAQYNGGGNCSSGDCQWIQVDGANFTPNAVLLVACYSSLNGWYNNYSATTDGSGALSSAGCFYGYPGETVWVVAGGVTSPSITWP